MARAKCPLLPILRDNPSFFSLDNDIPGWDEKAPRLIVPPLNVLRLCASQGCDLCMVMTAGSTRGCLAAYLPVIALEETPLVLSRAMLSYHQGITLYIGFDDLLPPKHFFRIPQPWSMWPRQASYSDSCLFLMLDHELSPARFNCVPEQKELLSCWLSNCLRNHPKCRALQRGFTPTRLLQIDYFADCQDVKLVDFSSNPGTVSYVALSHCWGAPSKRPIRTLQSNIVQHQERIKFQDLSRTFQDAVKVTRDLRLSYVWIDSLCIIQDSKDDWEMEAAQMGEVYRESICTLCALSSNDGDGGCRVNASGEEVDYLRYVDLDIGEYRIRLIETENNDERSILTWDVEYGDDEFKSRPWGGNPLRTRAWTFQERELSVRAIHFSRQTLLWECVEMKGSTEIPHGVIRRYDEFKPVPMQTLLSDAGAAQQDQWYGKVEDYTSRFLTRESDKLVAFSGYAQHFQREVLGGGTYLAGLWKEHFPGCLLWRVRRDERKPGERHPFEAFEPRRPIKYRAPTWSWASLDGEVTYASQRVVNQGGTPTQPSPSRVTLLTNEIGIENSFSHVPYGASMTLRGPVTQCEFDDFLEDSGSVDECKRRLYNKTGEALGFFYPDIMLEVQDIRHIWCLGVCNEIDTSMDLPEEVSSAEMGEFSERLMGIALYPNHDGSIFRRIGMVRWMKKAAFDEDSLSEVKII